MNRNPLDDIPGHLPFSPVVEQRGSRVGLAGEVLHVVWVVGAVTDGSRRVVLRGVLVASDGSFVLLRLAWR